MLILNHALQGRPIGQGTSILNTPQARLLSGQRVYVEKDVYLPQLQRKHAWITKQLAEEQHTKAFFDALQQAGKVAEDHINRRFPFYQT